MSSGRNKSVSIKCISQWCSKEREIDTLKGAIEGGRWGTANIASCKQHQNTTLRKYGVYNVRGSFLNLIRAKGCWGRTRKWSRGMTVNGIACCPLWSHSEMNHLNPADHIECCFIALKRGMQPRITPRGAVVVNAAFACDGSGFLVRRRDHH